MRVFYNHVGQAGADAHFPLTIEVKVGIQKINDSVTENHPYKDLLFQQLEQQFPSGEFNIWGVPIGANFVIRNMRPDDAVFLIERVNTSIHGPDGIIPYLGIVRVFIPQEFPSLSKGLWGDNRYPYIFFFDSEKIDISWMNFVTLLGFKESYNPRGQFLSVAEERLDRFG